MFKVEFTAEEIEKVLQAISVFPFKDIAPVSLFLIKRMDEAKSHAEMQQEQEKAGSDGKTD